MSSGSGSVSVGLILTLRTQEEGTPCPQTPEYTSSKGLQGPVWEAPSEEKVAETCASKGLQRPVWLDTEQSKTPQRATTPCWHLEPKQGFHNIGQEQGHTSVASDETCNFHIKAN